MQHHPENLLIFGDSIAYGSWDSQGGWADRLKRYREKLRREVGNYYLTYNLGIPGETVLGLGTRFNSEYRLRLSENRSTNGIIFAYGMNDLIPNSDGAKLAEMEQFELVYSKILEQAKNVADCIWVLGVTPIIESARVSSVLGRTNQSIESYNHIIKGLSQKLNVDFVDCYSSFRKSENLDVYVDIDGLHPNDAGHELIFDILTNVS